MNRTALLVICLFIGFCASGQGEGAIYEEIMATRSPNTVLDILSNVHISKVKNDSLRAYFYYYKGSALAQLGNLDESVTLIDSARKTIDEGAYPLIDIQIWRALGNIAWIRSFYNIALDHYQQGLKVSRNIDNPEFQISLLGNIAGVYAQLDDFDKALQYALEAEQVSAASGVVRPRSHMKIGLYLMELGNTQKAIESLMESIDKLKTEGKDTIALGVVNYNIAKGYLNINQPQEALYYLNQSQAFLDAVNYPDAQVYIEWGRYYMAQAQYDMAIEALNKAATLAERRKDLVKQQSTAILLKEIAIKQGKLLEAIALQDQVYALNDTIKSKKTLDRVYELETQFQTAQKEAEIDRLTLENSLQEANLARNRTALTATIVGGSLLIVLLIVFTVLRNKKLRAEREAQELQFEALQKRLFEIQSDRSSLSLSANIDDLNSKLHNDLTEREFEILRLSIDGKTNGEIAEELYISVSTVKFHLRNMYSKLGVNNRKEAFEYVVSKA